MAKLRLVIAVVAMAGCYHQDSSIDTAYPEPAEVHGPPGGEIDPGWQAQSYSGGDPDGSAGYVASAEVAASADPSAPGYVMGEVTDAEIDTTLDGYGEWVEVDGYGEVWRPYTTAVGVDFTPYETCGSWVWTDDWGWVYGCDWDWGWLAFHYGRWGWFDDYWAWVPDYTWGPAWVEWRGGGGYVGWRPLAPIVRDHRGRHHEHQGPIIRDHRSSTRVATLKNSHWRFATTEDFGKRNIRAHLFKNPSEGLRVTSIVTRPPIRGLVQPVRAASVMHGRLESLGINNGVASNPRGGRFGGQSMQPISPDTPTWNRHPRQTLGGADGGPGFDRSPGFDPTPGADPGVYAPGYSPGQTSAPGVRGGAADSLPTIEPGDGARPVPPGGGGNHLPEGRTPPDRFTPDRGPSTSSPGVSEPVQQPPAYHPPRGGTYAPQTPVSPPTWSPPSQPSAPTYSPPVHSAPTYSPPSHSSGGFSPSHSSGGSFSPPSHSSGGFSPSHSSGGGGGGGGRRR
ncbi:MAG TPA: DUF6600 domain-containing protein [Kofleriaceae bacterium]|nr:DUF6600 domain-containing protein [Kofleriaceae bacterium]